MYRQFDSYLVDQPDFYQLAYDDTREVFTPMRATEGALHFIDGAMNEAVDVASSTVTYIGQSAPGTPTGSPKWRIARITTVGTVTLTQWSNGNARFASVWDNRASLTY